MKTTVPPAPTFDDKLTLTAEVLRKTLGYSPDTGRFVWLKSMGAAKSGAEAGGVSSTGYVRIAVFGRRYQAHQLAWLHYYSEWPGELDHINGEPLDNRIANLRDSTNGENMQNQRRAHRNNQTGMLGVHCHEENGNYVAQIRVDGKVRHIGSYRTAEEAHYAYLQAKRRLHPNGEIAKGAEVEPEKMARKLPAHGFAGVEERCGRFRAFFYQNGKRVNVGTFDTAEEASEARKTAMKGG